MYAKNIDSFLTYLLLLIFTLLQIVIISQTSAYDRVLMLAGYKRCDSKMYSFIGGGNGEI